MLGLGIMAIVALFFGSVSVLLGVDPVKVMASAGVAAIMSALLAIASAIHELKRPG